MNEKQTKNTRCICGLALLSVLVAACGSSDDGGISGTGDPRITPADSTASAPIADNSGASGSTGPNTDQSDITESDGTFTISNTVTGGAAGLLADATPQFLSLIHI